MTDPFLMLMRQIGPDYIVWDKAATIDFIAPGRGTVHAQFHMPAAEVARLRDEAESGKAVLPQYRVEVLDGEGQRVASVLKTLYVRRKKDRGRAA